MIDIHCHILPEIDDGADSLQTAVMMAAMAADDGITGIVATPHIVWNGRSAAEKKNKICAACQRLQRTLEESRIPVTCYPGAEVLCADTEHCPPQVGVFPCICETAYTLVEFYFDAKAEEIQGHLERLLAGGLMPIIAHPERYTAVQKKKSLLDTWRQMGCYLQLNKNSFLGSFGRKARKIAEWAMEQGLADFLATDAHNSYDRTPQTRDIAAHLAHVYGNSYIKRLIETNPMSVLRGEKLERV